MKKLLLIFCFILSHYCSYAMEGSFQEKLIFEQIESDIKALMAYKNELSKPAAIFEVDQKITAVQEKIDALEEKITSQLKEQEKQLQKKSLQIILTRKVHYQTIISQLQELYKAPGITKKYNAYYTTIFTMADRIKEKSDWGPVTTAVQEETNAINALFLEKNKDYLAIKTKQYTISKDIKNKQIDACLELQLDPILENLFSKELALQRAFYTEFNPKELPQYATLRNTVDRLVFIKKLLTRSEDYTTVTPEQFVIGVGPTNNKTLPVFKNIADLNQELTKQKDVYGKFLAQKSIPGTEQAIAEARQKLHAISKTEDLEKQLVAAQKEEEELRSSLYNGTKKSAQKFFDALNAMYNDAELKKLAAEYHTHYSALFNEINNTGKIDTIIAIAHNEINLPTKRLQTEMNTIRTTINNLECDLSIIRSEGNHIKLVQERQKLKMEKNNILNKELPIAKRVALKEVDLAIQRLKTLKLILQDPINILRLTPKILTPLAQ